MRKKLLVATALTLALSGLGQSAKAQSWGYYGWGLGSSLLYPLSYVPYTLLYRGVYNFGNPSYGNSGYALNNLMNQNATAPYGYVPYGGRFGFNNSTNQPYANNGQYGYGQQGVNPQGQPQPYNNNGNNYDPNAYQQSWQNPPQNYQPAPGSGKRNKKAAPEQTTAFNPSPATPSADSVAEPLAPGGIPPIAPDRLNKSSPFADGFIQVIMTKFDGDVGQALKDKEMYSWAQALNVVDRKKMHHIDISASRKETIQAVLKDESLDSKAKLETLKILLK